MKKIVVFGPNGMLGRAVSRYFESRDMDVVRCGREQYDIFRDPVSRIPDIVSGADVVVNCAGTIKQRIDAYSVEETLRVNAVFPLNLARACGRRGARLVHVTTDCVYAGDRGRYDETAPFDADDLYGMSKNAGEPCADAMVLRTSIVGEQENGAFSLLEWARSQRGKSVRGYTNHFWNGVTTVHFAEIVERIFARDLHRPGTFHIFSPEIYSKRDMLAIISDVYGLDLAIEAVETPQGVDRSLTSIHPLSAQVADKPFRTQVEELKAFFA